MKLLVDAPKPTFYFGISCWAAKFALCCGISIFHRIPTEFVLIIELQGDCAIKTTEPYHVIQWTMNGMFVWFCTAHVGLSWRTYPVLSRFRLTLNTSWSTARLADELEFLSIHSLWASGEHIESSWKSSSKLLTAMTLLVVHIICYYSAQPRCSVRNFQEAIRNIAAKLKLWRRKYTANWGPEQGMGRWIMGHMGHGSLWATHSLLCWELVRNC